MRRSTPLIWVIALLLITGLACAQAGEIIAPEEATRRAQEEKDARIFSTESGETVEGATLQPGDTGELAGSSLLVNFFEEPGGQIMAGQSRGEIVEVLEVADDGERIWYKVKTPSSEGWVTEKSIEKVASADEDVDENAGPGPGDTVYLAGTGFLFNLLLEPNGGISTVQERGVPVVIKEVFTVDGELWYLVDAPSGEGWVPAEIISTEEP